MESEPPILLYLFSLALALVTLARLHHQPGWKQGALANPCRRSDHHR